MAASMRSRTIVIGLLLGCATRPDAVRFTEDAIAIGRFGRVIWSYSADGKGLAIVQTSSTTFTRADGREVVLVATHHLGTPEYFRSLESALHDADVIWAEGVTLGDGSEAASTDCPEPLKPLEEYYGLEAQVSGLSNQKDWEDGIRDGRWKSADLDTAQLEELYADDDPANWDVFTESLGRELARLRALSRGGVSDDTQRAARVGLVDGVSRFRKPEESWGVMNRERERAAWEAIRAGLGTGRRHAIIYGASHCPALTARLVEAGYVERSATWHDAFAVETRYGEH